MSPASQGDNKATFLAEFRALRNRAGLDYGELTARAHFPSDVLKGAEAGPDLPGLPVLVAYVRACDGDVAEWEERWRRLATDEPMPLSSDSEQDDGGLPVRPAGASPAAKAGARAGVTVGPADVHDPERIRAALRAHRDREEKALPGNGSVSATAAGSGNGSASGTGWAADPEATDEGDDSPTMLANGLGHRETSAAHTLASDSSSASATSWPPPTPWSPATSESAAPPESATAPESPWGGYSPAAEPDHRPSTSGHAYTNGRSSLNASSSLNGYSRDQRDQPSAAATQDGRSPGNGPLKLAAVLVFVVVIACILLLTV